MYCGIELGKGGYWGIIRELRAYVYKNYIFLIYDDNKKKYIAQPQDNWHSTSVLKSFS